jgi:hypothetical protein
MFDRDGRVQCVGCGNDMQVHTAETMLNATRWEFRCNSCDRVEQFLRPRARAEGVGRNQPASLSRKA